jgi:hypothetical protein
MGEAEQHGFSLILPVMRQDQMKNAFRMAALSQEAIPRITSPRLNARCGLSTLPPQDLMLDAMRFEPNTNLIRFGCGLMPQAMIDGQSQKGTVPAVGPGLHQQAERQTISSP